MCVKFDMNMDGDKLLDNGVTWGDISSRYVNSAGILRYLSQCRHDINLLHEW